MNILVTGDLVGGAGALWVSLLIDLVVKGSLLLAASWLLHELLKTLRPAHRSRMWTSLFLILIFVPLVTFAIFQTGAKLDQTLFGFLPRPVVTVVQGGASTNLHIITDSTENGPGSAIQAAEPGPPSAPSSDLIPVQPGPTEFRHWSFLVFVWLAGFFVLAGRTALRAVSGLLTARSSIQPAAQPVLRVAREVAEQLRISIPFKVIVCPVSKVPFLAGYFGNRLVLPAEMNTWPEDRIRPIILHELAHLKRRDTFRLVLGELVCALYWFNPLVWRSAAIARLDLELACDDIVCLHGVRRTVYARMLLQFAAGAAPVAHCHEVPGFASRLGLEVRLNHVLAGPGKGGRLAKARRGLIVVPVALAVVGSLAWTGAVLVEQVPPLTVDTVGPPVAVIENEPGLTPAFVDQRSIHDLAAAGDTKQIALLLDHDSALLDLADAKGLTPLAIAAWNGHLELVSDLLARGANADRKNNNGLTPLFCAVDRGRATLARLLIENGADVTTRGFDGRGMIHMAARSGDTWVLIRAIEQGADVSAPDRSGGTPLDLAVWGKHDHAIRTLEKRDAKRSNLPNPHEKIHKKADLKNFHVS